MGLRCRGKIICIIFIMLFVGSVFFLAVYSGLRKGREDIYEEMQNQNAEVQEEGANSTIQIPIDFDSLQEQNADIYAWIRIPGTVIDYPIVQHESDDSYYLNRTVERKEGLPGSIYTEPLNGKDFRDRNTLIYGHNMKNGSMFGDLSLYQDSDYMKEHGQMFIYTPEHIYTYQIFGAVTYDNRHILYAFDFSAEAGMQKYLDSIRSVRNMASYIDDEVDVSSADRIVTLSTCTGDKARRFLVEAVLVDVQ